jgi:hypothetical protein
VSDLAKAIGLIRKAEGDLREIMRSALAEERYSDLAEVAPLASILSNLLRSVEMNGTAKSSSGPAAADNSRQTVRTLSLAEKSRLIASIEKPARKNEEYPRFERDGDKLIKIGWSKKDRREYEHRVPKEIVLRVAEILRSAGDSRKTFAMDRLTPFKSSAGLKIPSYQVYLVLAWLRTLGAVQARGKDGYQVMDGRLDASHLNDAWIATTRRR